jgi:type II secretory pathway component PulF
MVLLVLVVLLVLLLVVVVVFGNNYAYAKKSYVIIKCAKISTSVRLCKVQYICLNVTTHQQP